MQEYDLAPIFASMPESLRSSEKDPQEQLTTWIPMPSSLKEKLHIEGHTLAANLTDRQHQLLKHTLEIWRNGERRQISIESRFIQTNVKTACSAESQITVQVPATTCLEVSSAVRLAAGESIVVAIPRVFSLEPGADADTTTIVTLTPRIISPQDTSASSAPYDSPE